MLKLHLGCGDRKIKDFINVDVRPDSAADVVCDLFDVGASFENVDLIYMCHVLEHFDRDESGRLLKSLYSILKFGGILRLSVPDFNQICRAYIDDNYDVDSLHGLTLGGHKNEFDYHYSLWDFVKLSKVLKSVGFRLVHFWDWRKVEHKDIDDYSQAYLPHMDKDYGRMMSLNIEAIK